MTENKKLDRERELEEEAAQFARNTIEFLSDCYDYQLNMAEAAHIRRLAKDMLLNGKFSNSIELVVVFINDMYGINIRHLQPDKQGKELGIKGPSLAEILQLIKQKYRPEQEKI